MLRKFLVLGFTFVFGGAGMFLGAQVSNSIPKDIHKSCDDAFKDTDDDNE